MNTIDSLIKKRLQFARANPKQTDIIKEFIEDLKPLKENQPIQEVVEKKGCKKIQGTGDGIDIIV